MTRDEYLQLRAQIEETCREDLRALERVWKLAGGTSTPADDEAEGDTASRNQKGRVDRLVRWSLTHMKEHDRFSVREIQGLLSQHYPDDAKAIPRASISSALVRLAESGALKVVLKGIGRTPSVYRHSPEPMPEEAPF